MNPKFIVLCCASLLVWGCSGNSVKVGKGLYLERFPENGKFYLRTRFDDSIGGVMDGVIYKIGWDNDFIIADVKRLYHGDPSGWYYFDLRNRTVGGPILEKELKTDPRFMRIYVEPSEVVFSRR
jgi:hypothetical protein